MFTMVRRRITFTNVALTLALVFAMTGGAYAASKYLITSTKQISPKVLKALAGKPGPAGTAGQAGAQGPQGSQGPAGTNGTPGANGTNGTPGTNGESVTAKPVATGGAKCGGLGGVEYTLASKTTPVCNGQTGFTETLPGGKTETGAWAGEGGENVIPISFSIQLGASLDQSHVHIVVTEPGHSIAECPGTVENPAATQGNLCVYESGSGTAGRLLLGIFDPAKSVLAASPPTIAVGAAASGAMLLTGATSTYASGTFAVTAAE